MRVFSTLAGLLAAAVLTASAVLPARADAAGDLENAQLNTTKQPYHMHITTEQGNAVDFDFVPPDRLHGNMPQGEVIVVGPTTYVSMGGSWFKFAGVSPVQSQANALHDFQANKGKYTVDDLGTKLVGGAPFHAYRVTETATKKVIVCYVDGDHRMSRIENGNTIVQYSNFGENVTITAPANARDMPHY